MCELFKNKKNDIYIIEGKMTLLCGINIWKPIVKTYNPIQFLKEHRNYDRNRLRFRKVG